MWSMEPNHRGVGPIGMGQGDQANEPQEGGIALKEFLPIVRGVVTFHCENTASVSMINSGYSRVPNIMHLLRCLIFIRAHFQLEAWAVHTPGVENGIADAISRNNMCRRYQ